MRTVVWFATASLVCVLGCADLWGFKDLSDSVDAAADQTTGPDSGAGTDATADRSVNAEDSSTDDASDSSSVDAGGGDEGNAEDAGSLEAGSDSGVDTGVPRDGGDAGDAAGEAGGKGDAGDAGGGGDAAPTDCAHTCDAGCCDSQGKCQAGTSPTVCGTNRATCQNCSTILSATCTGLTSPCCQKQACACATTALCL